MPPEQSGSLENKPMKVRVGIGPITLDVEDSADMLTLLVTKIVESFMGRKIIGQTASADALTELKGKIAA